MNNQLPWYLPLLTILLMAVWFMVVFAFFGTEIDLRPTSSAAYELMITWKDNPIRPNGIDYTSLIPMIDKAMEDGYVYRGEWSDILEASNAIKTEFLRQQLIAK